jgi:hypothetical protein
VCDDAAAVAGESGPAGQDCEARSNDRAAALFIPSGRLDASVETLETLQRIGQLCAKLAPSHPLSMLGTQATTAARLLARCQAAGVDITGVSSFQHQDQGLGSLVDRLQFTLFAHTDNGSWAAHQQALLSTEEKEEERKGGPSSNEPLSSSGLAASSTPSSSVSAAGGGVDSGRSAIALMAARFHRLGVVLPVPAMSVRGATAVERARALALSDVETARCHEAALRYYNDVIHTVNTLQLQDVLNDIGFTEFKLRAAGRYDMRVPLFDTLPCFGAAAPWWPLVRQILGDDAVRIHVGCMLSMPGSVAQNWHMDGDHLSETVQRPAHCINVFVPLVDMNERLGPTEMLPASHIDWNGLGGLAASVSPCCGAGECLFFDYRLRHRGLGNRGDKPRPLVYITYAKPFFQDTYNFSKQRYEQLPPLVSQSSREERSKRCTQPSDPTQSQESGA